MRLKIEKTELLGHDVIDLSCICSEATAVNLRKAFRSVDREGYAKAEVRYKSE